MIHLKRFNENSENTDNKNFIDWKLYLIRNFCYNNLSYLFDNKDTDINFNYSYEKKIYTIIINDINLEWNDLEHDICPFLELLEDKYSLVNIISDNQIEIRYESDDKIWYSVSEILSGCVENSLNISGIRIMISI